MSIKLNTLKARIAGLCFCAVLVACSKEEAPTNQLPTSATLQGTVMYRERMPLRLDSVIRVRLEDVSLADAPAMVLGETEFPAKGLSVPVPFSITYDPSRIEDRFTYAVRAEIRGGNGELLWTTTTHHPVFTRGGPADNVEIMVELVAR